MDSKKQKIMEKEKKKRKVFLWTEKEVKNLKCSLGDSILLGDGSKLDVCSQEAVTQILLGVCCQCALSFKVG